MRYALSIFDQVVSFSGNDITYQKVIENLNVLDYDYYFNLTDAFLKNDISKALLLFNEILDKGFDAHHFINGLSEHFRDLLVCRDKSTLELLEVGANIRDRYQQQTQHCPPDFLFQALEISNKCDVSYRMSRNKRLHVELSIIGMCNITLEKKKSELKKTDTSISKPTNEGGERTKAPTSSSPKQVIENKAEETKQTIKSSPPEAGGISSFSIKKKLSEQQSDSSAEKTTESHETLVVEEPFTDNNNFTEQELVEKWHIFSDTLGNRPRIFNTLTSKDPKLEDNYTISFVIDNNLQEEKINEIRNELLSFLKKELKNSAIDLRIIVTEIEEDTSKLYTSEDKFKHMLSKNENLAKLKQEFNLDIE